MALSEYEKEVLAELEAEFANDTTPQGQSTRQAANEHKARPTSSPATLKTTTPLLSTAPRRIALGSVIALAGLAGVLTAVSLGYSLWSVLLGVASFMVAVGGIYFALQSPKQDRPKLKVVSSQRADSALARFMARQHDRWDRRQL